MKMICEGFDPLRCTDELLGTCPVGEEHEFEDEYCNREREWCEQVGREVRCEEVEGAE